MCLSLWPALGGIGEGPDADARGATAVLPAPLHRIQGRRVSFPASRRANGVLRVTVLPVVKVEYPASALIRSYPVTYHLNSY